MSQRYIAPIPAVPHYCLGCGVRVLITERAVAQGFSCKDCNCSSWSRLPGEAAVRGFEGERRREGRA
jgi:hypothetical protein